MKLKEAFLKGGALMVGGLVGVSASEYVKRKIWADQPFLADVSLASLGAFLVYRQAVKDPKSAWLFFWIGAMGESAVRAFRVLMGEPLAESLQPPSREILTGDDVKGKASTGASTALLLALLPP